MKIIKVIDDFLNNNSERFLVIGATYGIGKTSLAKMTVSKYSNQLLELDKSILQNSNYSNYGKYFPIIIYLRNGLKSEFNDWSLEYLFDEIIGNENESKKRRILLILDGLDEYPDKIDELEKTIQKYVNYYYKLKIILTTRLLPGLENNLSTLSKKKYTRLLSFTPDKVNELFSEYINEEQKSNLKKKYGIDCLTFRYISKDIGITNDKNFEITNPLFAWMLILLYTSTELKIEFKQNWGKKFRKSLIYMFFVHYVISGKYSGITEPFRLNKSYYLEKKSLRIIAKLKHFKKHELFWTECENEIKSFFGANVDTQMLDKTLKSILHTYFFSPFQTTARKVNFIHKTFMEYLLAEYYIECFLFGNEAAVNIGKPSFATMEFLDGLIEILNSNDKDTKNRFIDYNEENEITLLNSFDYKKSQNNARIDIINTCLNCVRTRSIAFLNPHMVEGNKWFQVTPNIDSYDELWIHRWISLRILLLLQHEIIKDIKDEIIDMFKTSAIVSNALIFKLNLSKADLSGASLSKANLDWTNLSKANLSGANLDWAILSKANLSGASLGGLTNLIGASLDKANLSGANLSGANLSNSIIIGIHSFEFTDLNDTIFTNAIVDNPYFIDYISKHTEKTPEIIIDKKVLETKLKERGIPEEKIKELLYISKFPK